MAEPELPLSALDQIRKIVEEQADASATSGAIVPVRIGAIPAPRPPSPTQAANEADATPDLGGGLERFAGLLSLSPAMNLFNRVAILNFGHLKRGNPFQMQKRESIWVFRICLGIDLFIRGSAALLLLAAVAVALWKALFR